MSTVIGDKNQKRSSGSKKVKSALDISREKANDARVKNTATVFQRVDGKMGTQLIQARCIANEDGTLIALRYVPGIRELEEEKQGDMSGMKAKAIVLRNGKLITSDKTLIEYMRRNPRNKANGGSVFYEFNAVEEAENLLQLEILRDEAKYMASKGLDSDQVRAMAKIVKTPNADLLHEAELRRDLRAYANEHPREFLDLIESPEPEINEILNFALSEGKLKFSNGGKTLIWDGGDVVVELPALKHDNRIPWLVRWMMTDKKGVETLEILRG